MRYDLYRTAFSHLPKPFAYADLSRFDENARSVLERAGGKSVRIATKSVRCTALLRRLLSMDARFRGLMAYTADEAAWLARQGFDDILIGYPCTEPAHLTAAAEQVRAGKTILFMADLPEHLDLLEAAAVRAGVRLSVCVDIDLSSRFPLLYFGVYRSAIVGQADLERFLAHLRERCAHLDLKGLMGYEAQIAGVGDAVAGQAPKNLAVRLLKSRSRREVARRRAESVALIRAHGHELPLVNAGGTGSLESSSSETVVTEVTAGSAFYAPHLFDHYAGFRHLPAAGFALAVTRRPAPDVATCLGGGYVASGETGPAKAPRPYLPEGLSLLSHEMAGEVQTPLRLPAGMALRPGDPVFFRHAKAGELCEHFPALHLLSADGSVETVPTYRGEGQCFL
jgi:D-serine deaminase-like pyridoxal phosphate-dependent protein